MKNVSKKEDYGYNSPFPSILRNLMDSRNVTQATLAKKCGVQRQTVGQWKDGNTIPDILSLMKLAEYFEVSTDYLLGMAKEPTNDKDISAVCEITGLNITSVDNLKKLADYKLSNIINKFLGHPRFIVFSLHLLDFVKSKKDVDAKLQEFKQKITYYEGTIPNDLIRYAAKISLNTSSCIYGEANDVINAEYDMKFSKFKMFDFFNGMLDNLDECKENTDGNSTET